VDAATAENEKSLLKTERLVARRAGGISHGGVTITLLSAASWNKRAAARNGHQRHATNMVRGLAPALAYRGLRIFEASTCAT